MIFSRDRISVLLVFCALLFVFVPASAQEQYRFRYFNKEDGVSQSSVFAIEQDATGFLWFGTRDGLNKYDGYDFTIFRTTEGLVNNDVRAILHDSTTNILWVGTLGGLSKYDISKEQFTSYRFHDGSGLNSNSIRFIKRGKAGRLWVGTSVGLNYLDEKNNQFLEVKSAKLPLEVMDMLISSNGVVYLGTNKGLFTLSKGESKEPEITLVSGLLSSDRFYINTLIEARDGSIWLGTEGMGVIRWEPATDSFRQFKSIENKKGSLNHNRVRSIIQDKAGNIWVGTFRGLNKITASGECCDAMPEDEYGPGGIRNGSIRDLYIDQRGALWVGTYSNGLFSIDVDSGKQEHFTTKEGLPGNSIFGILADEAGDLWLSTNNGLARFEIDNHRITSYDQSHGLRALEYNFNAYHRLRNGEMLFGGIRGFTLFNPEAIYYVYKSYWSDEPFAYIESHTWTERSGPRGKAREISVYSSCESLELFHNGKSLGRKTKDISQFPASGYHWPVQFVDGPNTLSAKAYNGGKEVATDELKVDYSFEKAETPHKVVLSSTPLPNGNQLVHATMVDKKGRRCLGYEGRMYFDCNGTGELMVNYGTPTRSQVIEMANGRASIELVPAAGRTVIEARNQDFKGSYLVLNFDEEGRVSASRP